MTRNEHLMVIAMEECVEVAQRLSKALRFGLTEIQPEQLATNSERIRYEYTDLVAVLDMLGVKVGSREQIALKQTKVEYFLAYSERCGTVAETTEGKP